MPQKLSKSEMADLAGYRLEALRDDTVMLGYLLRKEHWSAANARLFSLRQNVELLAGYLAQIGPTKDHEQDA